MSGGIYTTDKSLDTIVSLGDVSTDNLQNNEVLLYNATSGFWENGTVGGGNAVEVEDDRNLVSKLGTSGQNLTSSAIGNVLLGADVGSIITTQNVNVAIGFNSLSSGSVGQNNIIIGRNTARTGTDNRNDNICIGNECCENANFHFNQNVAIGYRAVKDGGINVSVVLGSEAGRQGDITHGVVMGYSSCRFGTTNNIIAIGKTAHYNGTDNNGICLGERTGFSGCGDHSILIGTKAGEGGKFDRSIVLNATGAQVNATSADSCVIKPVRGVAHGIGVGVMKYDPTTGEITYSTT